MGFKWGQELLKAKQIIKEQDECIKELKKENDYLDFACYDLEQEHEALKQENAELCEYIRELRKEIVELKDSL
jgi:chromosome segregation ATPase